MPSLLFRQLLSGMYAIKAKNHNGRVGYKTYSGNMSPESFHRENAFLKIKHVLNVDKKGRWIISRNAIRKLHGNDSMKIYYKLLNRKSIL